MSIIPNDDQAAGKIKQAQGRAEDAAGAVTGDDETRVKGVAKEAEGKVQEAVGNVKKAVHEATR